LARPPLLAISPKSRAHHLDLMLVLVLQRDFSQLTALGKPSLPMGDIRRMVPTLPVAHEVQDQLAVKLPLGQDADQQHLHLGQGQARRFLLS
jgi:hypothetical protein